jgi:hypothetical protein
VSVVNAPIVCGICPTNWLLKRLLHGAWQSELADTKVVKSTTYNSASAANRPIAKGIVPFNKLPKRLLLEKKKSARHTKTVKSTTYNSVSDTNCPIAKGIDPVNWTLSRALQTDLELQHKRRFREHTDE